jgi:hypothetical protein
MNWVIGLSSLALLAGVLATWIAGRGKQSRWGRTIETTPPLGEGMYRRAPVRIERPRRIPAICRLASVTVFAWGALTVFVFAPAGVLLFIMVLGEIVERGWLFALATAGLVVAVIRGFTVGTRLMLAVNVLAARTADSVESVRRVARQSLFHHALVATVLVLFGFSARADAIFFALFFIPCAIGAAQAALLLGARATIDRLDREDAAARDLV